MLAAAIVQAASTVALAAITAWYAREARRMRQQSLRPVVLVEPVERGGHELIADGLGAAQGELPEVLDCTLRNAGPGPALEVGAVLRPYGKVDRPLLQLSADEVTEKWPMLLEGRGALRAGERAARSGRVVYKDVFGNQFATTLRVFLGASDTIIRFALELE